MRCRLPGNADAVIMPPAHQLPPGNAPGAYPEKRILDRQMDTAASYLTRITTMRLILMPMLLPCMSVSWFIRNFKKYTGETPVQFITSLRMTNAQVLLENTTYSINEIARIVGYNNALYFSRIFHKQKGCSPSQYRTRSHET